jgi:hypothetical protein
MDKVKGVEWEAQFLIDIVDNEAQVRRDPMIYKQSPALAVFGALTKWVV